MAGMIHTSPCGGGCRPDPRPWPSGEQVRAVRDVLASRGLELCPRQISAIARELVAQGVVTEVRS